MVIFLDTRGSEITPISAPEQIGRNSNDAALICIVSPLSSAAQIYMTFTLPNGETLFGDLLKRVTEGGERAEAIQATHIFDIPDHLLAVWRYAVPASVTRLAGRVDYTVVTVMEGGMVATASGSFNVSKGNKITTPTVDDTEPWHDVLSAISEAQASADQVGEDLQTFKEEVERTLESIGSTEGSTVPEPGKVAAYNEKGELTVSLQFNGEEKTGAAVPINVVAEIVEGAVAANATSIRINADASTNKLSIDLLNANGEVVASSAEVELPIGQFVEAVLSDDGKNVIFTLANGSTVTIPTESIGGGGVNIELEQTTGTRTDAAMSQKAVTDALDGKLDKPASNGSTSVFQSINKYGEQETIAAAAAGGIKVVNGMFQLDSPNEGEIGKKVSSVNAPLKPRNIDLVVKTGVTTNTLTLTADEKKAAQSWLGVTGELDSIKAAVSGRLYDYVTDSDVYATKTPPANALSYAYLMHVGHVIIPADVGTEYADVEFIAAFDANGNEVHRYEPTAPQLINIDGVSRIVFYPPSNVAVGRDYYVESSIMYQVKVEV